MHFIIAPDDCNLVVEKRALSNQSAFSLYVGVFTHDVCFTSNLERQNDHTGFSCFEISHISAPVLTILFDFFMCATEQYYTTIVMFDLLKQH